MTKHSTTRRADAKILALETEINRLFAASAKICEERVEPHSEEFGKLATKWGRSRLKADRQAMLHFLKVSGRDQAIEESDKLFGRADKLIDAMWAMPAATEQGRAAKARVFFAHIASDVFRGPDDELDWDISLCRRLLFEYSGLNEAHVDLSRRYTPPPPHEADHART